MPTKFPIVKIKKNAYPDVHPFPNFVPNPTQNPAIANPQSLKLPINTFGSSNNGVVSMKYLQ